MEYQSSMDERVEQARLLDAIRTAVAKEMPGIVVAGDQSHRHCDLAFDVGERAQVSREDRQQLVRILEREGARATVSSVHAHAVPGHWNKATGVAHVFRKVLGLDLDQARRTWIFVGDSGNDQAAFEWFEVSVGVANVLEHRDALTSLPLYVTEADRGSGFAEVAARLVR